ncbi:helix-turn-helix transcriptional regulator [Yoonia litorea]|uniref:Predicted DNA-binding transcriptional regulator YafY, contains an HTH and WYL domains n=1 Tax=Yoonia litorea TaxID=1123755 RepID=A0A1I6LAY8_9RHOB|nr:YafY family protein [Yoonia litorea]SFS00584.1 Predicted DNA-binding transcriptional regulator YafY, contains an HTH and WYL domains [Yoonia litorea]
MRRADRLFQILQFLRGGRLTTAAQLAEKLEVTPRTIYRDIAHLIGSGVPIEGEAGVGYLMRDGYDLPPLMFTHDEIVALVSGARVLQAWGGTKMASAAQEALIKIDAVLPEAARAKVGQVKVHALEGYASQGQWRDYLDVFEAAAETQTRLEIAYADEREQVTNRTVRPLGVWFWGKVWTAVCWCELRADFRMFRLDRIASVKTCNRFRAEKGQTLRDFYEAEAYLHPRT